MNRFGGGFWEGGTKAIEEMNWGRDAVADEDRESAEWEREAVNALESLATVGVQEG